MDAGGGGGDSVMTVVVDLAGLYRVERIERRDFIGVVDMVGRRDEL